MSNLIHKSYGVFVDSDFFHYESCCPECRRPFVVQLRDMVPAMAEEEGMDVTEMTLPAPPPPTSFVIDLEKYNTLDSPDFNLSPNSPYLLRVELVID